MNAVVFGVVAILLCSAVAAAVAAPAVRFAGPAYGGVILLTSVLLIGTGSALLGLALLAATAATAGAAYLLVHTETEKDRGVINEGWQRDSRWKLELPVIAVLFLALILSVGLAGRWHEGGLSASLATLLHYRYPFTFLVLGILALAAVAAVMLIGGVQADEQTHAQDRADKELRAERMARRRADRAAAKQQRRERRREGS